jgi:hypothetical protein
MVKIKWILIIGLLALLIYTRFVNIGWGLPYPMHPDERNMANAIQSLNCEVQSSEFRVQNCFNPHFFAYGQFPLYLGYLLILLGRLGGLEKLGGPISFQEAVLSLRIISAAAAILNVIIVIKIIKIIIRKIRWVDFLIFFPILIFSPGLIQFAHFGTTESLLMLFYSLIIYQSLRLIDDGDNIVNIYWLGLWSGLAVATKVSAGIFLLLPLIVIMTNFARPSPRWYSGKRLGEALRLIFITTIIGILFSPYNLISFGEFLGALRYESEIALGRYGVFYTRQFIGTMPVIFQFSKIFPYALGWPVVVLGGLGMLGGLGWKDKSVNLLRLAFLVYFIPNAFLLAKWTRFMAPIFPLLLIFAALILAKIKIKIIKVIMVIITIIPGSAYLSIYQKADVRFQASQWIYKNIPNGAYILSETGNAVDLPLANRNYNDYKNYKIISFNFYDLDSNPKLVQELQYHLSQASYIIVPSRRIFMNHPPNGYPLLNNYYEKLFSGSLGFKKIAEFTSYPKLQLQIEMPDEQAEETWTVFDHPVIRIYKKSKGLKLKKIERFEAKQPRGLICI